MVKKFMTIAGLVLCAGGVQAQDTLQVQGTTPDLYLTHIVRKGENFYSLGRAYGLSPKEIAAGNNISMEQGLQLGQRVKIPLTAANFNQQSGGGAGYRPVYHKVAEKETLYRVSVNHNKVSLDNIRQWNHFTGDGLKKGSYIIVGWVKSNGAAAPPVAASPAPSSPAAPVPAPPVMVAPPVANSPAPQPNQSVSTAITPAPPVQTTPEPAKQADSNRAASIPASVPAATAGTSFEQIYMQQTNNGKKATSEKGPGSWFKSNAGPGKYYALHNSAPRGTIIKVTNPLNGKAIYAKVLEAIPQIKQNAGLIIKLSDSAIEALGTNEARFYCELSYED